MYAILSSISPITEAFGVEWHDEAASSAADSSLMAHSLHLGDGLNDRYRHSYIGYTIFAYSKQG